MFLCNSYENWTDEVEQALEETIDVAKEAGVHLHVSHLKAMGYKNFGKCN